ncbi:MAG: hypothetical protein HY863_19145 [Chloroflexi bacterium]|nr:hypothetical protein [Chloroflexota bacterium]
MSRPLYIFILMALALSACGGQAAPTQLPATAISINQTPSPVPTITTAPSGPTAISTLADTPIAPTLPPTNDPSCTNDATFVTDVTVPDGTVFNPGTTYTKTWRIKNSGTCAWNSTYSIVFSSGEKSGAPDSTPLAYTAPGGTLDISLELTAPVKTGNTNSFFELHNPSGSPIPISGGSYLYSSIYVNESAATTVANPAATQPSATAVSGSSGGVPDSACPYTTDASKAADVISAINSYRAQNGLPAYNVNSLLNQAAQTHAADMACNNLFYHTGSDGSNPVSRVANSGYLASSVTENVYGSYPPLSGQGVVAWWATDQLDLRHNQNLLSTKYTDIGVAYTFYNNYGYYVVDFATGRNN